MADPDLAPAQESYAELMADVVEITAPADTDDPGAYNPTTRTYDRPPPAVVYRGRAKLRGVDPVEVEVAAGVTELAAAYDVALPLIGRDDPDLVEFDPVPALGEHVAEVADGAVLVVLSARRDPAMVGLALRCSPGRVGTLPIARRVAGVAVKARQASR